VEPVSVYYWLFAGLLLKLPEISEETIVEKQEIEQ
jgi:hypothetical protein